MIDRPRDALYDHLVDRLVTNPAPAAYNLILYVVGGSEEAAETRAAMMVAVALNGISLEGFRIRSNEAVAATSRGHSEATAY